MSEPADRDSQDGRETPSHLSPSVIAKGRGGQIVGRQALSQKEDKLAGLLAAGVPTGMAGELAGYADPAASASRAKRSPAVAARVLELQRLRIGRTGALAIRVIEEILSGKIPAPASVRLDAGKYVLKVNGVELQADKRSDSKDLRHMTMAELMEIAAAFKAKTAPTVPGDDAQVIEGTAESVT